LDKPFAAYNGDAPYLFVCYAHDDKALVYPELVRLKDAGFNVWYDEGISPGSEWSDSIASHIEGCAVFLYFVTPRAIASEHCRREVNFAVEQPCGTLAIHLERTDLPSGLKLSLSNRQAILKYDESLSAYEDKLVQAIGSITGTPSDAAAPRRATTADPDATTAANRPTIAVLPFSNLSNDPDQEYFSDGISEDILDRLGRNRSLTVRARQSSFFFKGLNTEPREIADRLNVSYLVNGSVRSQGNRIRVTARLTDIVANADVWSEHYDREMTDVFAVQDEITESVVKALGVHFSVIERRPVNVDAYRAYLLGRYHQTHWNMMPAMESFEQAIELDSTYADAYAALAWNYYTQKYLPAADVERLDEKERGAIGKALEHDAHQPTALALAAYSLPTTMSQEAIDAFDRLIGLAPNSPEASRFYGLLLQRIGRFEESRVMMDKAVVLDPLAPNLILTRGDCRAAAGHIEAAKDDFRQCELLGLPMPKFNAEIALLEQDLESLKTQCARPPSDWELNQFGVVYAAYLAFLEGDRERVAQLEAQLEKFPYVPHHVIALLKGENELAADRLESSIKRGEPEALLRILGTTLYRMINPNFFNGDRYQAILRKLHLDEESLAKLSVPTLPL
jgi:TolB-like protein/Tfp pilus assembly protein PilF